MLLASMSTSRSGYTSRLGAKSRATTSLGQSVQPLDSVIGTKGTGVQSALGSNRGLVLDRNLHLGSAAIRSDHTLKFETS